MNERHRFPLPHRALLLLVPAAAVVVSLIVLLTRRSATPVAAPAEPATAVLTTPASRGAISRTLSISGLIRADSETQLAARMPTRIMAVLVREGDRVRRGQILVRLDEREARSMLEEATAGVRAAEAALAKAQRGIGVRSVEAAAGVATAAAAVEAARARVRQARGAVRAAEAEAAAEQQRAEAALEAAHANLAVALRGGRPSQLRQAEASVAQAQAAWQAARRGLEDARFLHDRGGLTRDRLEGAVTAETTARAQLEAARAALEQAREGAAPEERRAAQAAVRQAEAGLAAARAGSRRARLSRQEAAVAEAQLRQAEAALRVARAGTAGSAAARDDVRAAGAALDQAQAQRRRAADQLAGTRLVSPADGVVTHRAADPGQIAQPGQPLVTVAAGTLYLEAPVNAAVVRLLRPRQEVDLVTDAVPGRTFRAILEDVPPVPGPDGRTYVVRARVLAQPGALPPGVRARGSVRVASVPDAILVPPHAVQRASDGPVVWVVRDGRAERRPVGLGLESGDAVQILSGVAPGEAVVVSGWEDLRPGDPVEAADQSTQTGWNIPRPDVSHDTGYPPPDTPAHGARQPWA